jgi:hypothetical protein
MEKYKDEVIMTSNLEGIEQVRDKAGLFAFFVESTIIEYNVERVCGLAQVGKLLDNKGYGVALHKSNKPYDEQSQENYAS